MDPEALRPGADDNETGRRTMRMEDYNLTGQHVRIVWNVHTSFGPHNGQTIFRGNVYQRDEMGLWVWGSFFVERADTISVREVPRDKNPESRLYYAPWSSIEVVQIVEEGTKEFEVHELILSRRAEAAKSLTPPSR
jgi:hypothetical protein